MEGPIVQAQPAAAGATASASKARGLLERLKLPGSVRTGLDAIMDMGKTMTTISTDTDPLAGSAARR
ncbi:hypothetical protein [Nonomuraea zeae]|uniref:Uncharacterized protein n=1 Tax=Nonomuraea zeae TaxID=1642303 RepID=A0A5S4H017_9ACTN|nr:hypothetical protein [Nonomuraea zeae]TMR38024.1 hypothetical protein ETD85_06165 [Nonomuraea zeae]